jgi:hypothetical protein
MRRSPIHGRARRLAAGGSRAGTVRARAPFLRGVRARAAVLHALLGCIAVLACTAGVPAAADAAANPEDSLIYMPYGLIHSIHSSAEVDEYLSQIDSFDIAQVVFAMPKFHKLGVLKVPRHNREMLLRFSSRMAAYDGEHGRGLSLTIVFNGKIGTRPGELNLEDAATRANIIAGVQSSLGLGTSGVQLDLEPYPTTPGFIALLEELDGALAREGFHGRVSVTAPATISSWSPAYLGAVSRLVTQLDPLYYDSESKTRAAYEQWMLSSLAYYSANASPATRLVPVLPSYSANRWHIPSVENIESATAALSEALAAGSRINGAGIWSGWGFLLDEEGAYDGAPDRAAWQAGTVSLPFSP